MCPNFRLVVNMCMSVFKELLGFQSTGGQSPSVTPRLKSPERLQDDNNTRPTKQNKNKNNASTPLKFFANMDAPPPTNHQNENQPARPSKKEKKSNLAPPPRDTVNKGFKNKRFKLVSPTSQNSPTTGATECVRACSLALRARAHL